MQFYAVTQGLPFWVNVADSCISADKKALAFWYGSTLIRTGEYTLLQFYICQMAILMGAQGAGQAFSFAPDMTKAKSATAEVSRLLDHEPEIDIWKADGNHVNVLEAGHIQFNDISFTYPSRSSPKMAEEADLVRKKWSSKMSVLKYQLGNMLRWLDLPVVVSQRSLLSSRDSMTRHRA